MRYAETQPDICVELANNSKSLSIDTHGLWSQQRRDHLCLVRLKRDENTRRIVNSRAYPNLVTVIGIDRMNAIKLPWQVPFPKSWITKNRLRYEVISVVDFNQYTHCMHHGLNVFPHDSDTTMTLLYFKLCELRISGKIGLKLQLHMDNFYRENKNRYMFAFCCMLIYHNWIEEVNIFFLLPGHTHAEVDATFVPIGKGI